MNCYACRTTSIVVVMKEKRKMGNNIHNRLITHSWVCHIIVSLILCAILCISGFAAIAEESDTANQFTYVKASVDGYGSFYYRDAMLLRDSRSLSTDLVKASAVIAAAAYNAGKVRDVLEDMGFSSFDDKGSYALVDSMPLTNCDYVAFHIAKKIVNYEGQKYIIYCVPIKGTTGNYEWFSNMNIGENGSDDHEGFFRASTQVLSALEDELATTRSTYGASNTIIWLTGHSRGAAVANLVAGRLTRGYSYVPAENIFAYTYACPSVSKNVSEFNNIYNFNIRGDLIPILPLEEWGYGRFGHTIKLDSPSGVPSSTVGYEESLKLLFPNELAAHSLSGKLALGIIANVMIGEKKLGFIELLDYLGYTIDANDFAEFLVSYGNASFADLYNAVESKLNHYDELKREWYDYYTILDSMSEEEQEQWLLDNSGIVNELSKITGQPIPDVDAVWSSYVYLTHLVNADSQPHDIERTIKNVYDMLIDANTLNLKAMVTDGHKQASYTTSINTKYYGYYGCTGRTGDVEIPGDITSIGEGCFNNCTGLTSISGGSLELIGDYAFSGCTGLTGNLDFIEDVYAIGESAFKNCKGLIGNPLIFTELTSIGESAFFDCDGLESLEIPDSAIMIGEYAFYYCDGLKRIKLPVSTQYGKNTFDGFTDRGIPEIEEIEFTFGDGTVFIPLFDQVFQSITSCKESLRTVIIDDRITELPGPFNDNPNLTTVKTNVSEEGVTFALPSRLQKINGCAFENCSNLTGELVIPAGVTSIGDSAFAGCGGLTGLVIQAGLTSVGDSAFEDCSGMTGDLVVPEGVTSIGDYAFYGCAGLESLEILDGAATIGDGSFCHCSGLQRVKLPISTRYENQAFTGCSGIQEVEYTYGDGTVYTPNYLEFSLYPVCALKTVILDDRITGLYAQMFDGCTELTTVKTNVSEEGVTFALPSQLREIPAYLFNNCGSLTGDLVIPAGVTSIGNNAFNNCSGLTGKLAIPAGVTAIGNRAFYNCGGLTGDLVIPEGTKSIGDDAFGFCSSLEGNLVIPEGVTSIGRMAFRYCENLTGSLVIPASATSIGGYAFCGCSSLAGNLVIPEGLTTIGEGWFCSCSGLTGDLVIPASVTSIGDSAFSGCSGLTGNLVIPASVTNIGDSAFSGCSGLTGNLVIPEGVTSIGNSAFRDCSGLTGDLVIPAGVTRIGDLSFYCCKSLKGNLIITANVTSIGSYAFYYCDGLTGDLVIPAGVTSIGDYAFAYCKCLTGDLAIPETVTSIGNSAYYECRSIASVAIMNRDCEIYDTWGTIPEYISIHGYEGSTAHDYATRYGNPFIDLEASACTLSCSEAVLTVGDTVMPAAWLDNQEITDFNLVSSDSGVVEIDGGVMKMVGEGVATVKLKANGTQKAEGVLSIIVKNQSTMILPKSLQVIQQEAFAYATGERIEIPENVVAIEASAFAGNAALQTVVFLGDNVSLDPMMLEGSDHAVFLCHRDSSAVMFALSNGMQYLLLQN